jgi:hypothetical protein
MIPDLQSSLICDDVRQERSGKFILIGLYDMIGLPRFPAVMQRVCLVNRWCCGTGQFKQKIRILGADGTQIVASGREVELSLPDSEATATSVEYFLNVKLPGPGTYWVEVLLDGDLKLRYPLKVQQVHPPAGRAPEGVA